MPTSPPKRKSRGEPLPLIIPEGAKVSREVRALLKQQQRDSDDSDDSSDDDTGADKDKASDTVAGKDKPSDTAAGKDDKNSDVKTDE